MYPFINEKALDFIDREDIIKSVDNVYYKILQDKTLFQIYSIHGAGGMGKSRLLKTINELMCKKGAKPIYFTLEITHNDDILNVLIKFRKKLPSNHYYPLFDFAMLIVWNSINVQKLNEDFLSIAENSTLNFLKDAFDVPLGIYPGIPVASAISSFISCYEKIKQLYQRKDVCDILEKIKIQPVNEIINELPQLLGVDIHKAFLEESLIVIIDSYKRYSSGLNEYNNWLSVVLDNIHYGLFVISSREKIKWSSFVDEKYVVPVDLSILPEDETRNKLTELFPAAANLIDNIIKVTDCIPIYLDLAVKTINRMDSKELVTKDIYFKDKCDIVQRFLNHLDENEQEVLTVLAVVQIFDRYIFENLVKDLNLPFPVTKFYSLCERTLIRNIEHDDQFFKIHDIISENIANTTRAEEKARIFSSYLKYIAKRGCVIYTSLQLNMLFKHLVGLCINNEIILNETETENLLDIFFSVKESLLPFDCDEIKGFSTSPELRNIYLFLKAIARERDNSKDRLELLEKIDISNCNFGKHMKSLCIMTGYMKALCISTRCLKDVIEPINKSLSLREASEWYYGQAKIYYGDCCISYGMFQTGIDELENYQETIKNLPLKKNDAFQITRHIAHGYRFNMFLDEAEELYKSLIYGKNIFPTPFQKVYILTNLCETECYFKGDEVIKIYLEALKLAISLKDLKSCGKIYYSMAIVFLVKKQSKTAKHFIDKSIACNEADGYVAGKLYAYIVQAYYDYALYKVVSSKTLSIIEETQSKIEVYSCYYLPLYIMNEEYSKLPILKQKLEWLDFYKTALVYRKFLESLI